MMYSAYKLNKQGDNIQPWRTPFPIWNQSVVPCPVLTVASWPAYRFLKGQIKRSSIPVSFRFFPQFVVVYTVKGFVIVNKTEVDVLLELSCFFDDPTDVGNLISGSSTYSKSSLNIWKFMVHVLLKPGLDNFEYYFTSMWDVQLCGSLSILWHCLSLGLEWKLTFSSPVATAEFSKFPGILNVALSQHHLLGFEIARIPSPPLSVFILGSWVSSYWGHGVVIFHHLELFLIHCFWFHVFSLFFLLFSSSFMFGCPNACF